MNDEYSLNWVEIESRPQLYNNQVIVQELCVAVASCPLMSSRVQKWNGA